MNRVMHASTATFACLMVMAGSTLHAATDLFGTTLGSASSAANQLFSLDVSAVSGVTIGDFVEIENTDFRGDFSGTTESVLVAFGSTTGPSASIGVVGADSSAWQGPDASADGITVQVIDIGGGTPGINVFVSPTTDVNFSPTGMPNGWWWNLRIDVNLSVPVCGDGLIQGSEECDDMNTTPGDGCDAMCDIESGWSCAGEPSVCTPPEDCFDGIDNDGDGNIDCDDRECGVDPFPLSNGIDADFVEGQDNFTTGTPGLSANEYTDVYDMAFDPLTGKVFVSDLGNSRVLRYESVKAFVQNQDAEAVFGQPDFVSNTPRTTQNGLSGNTGIDVCSDGTLWVTDWGNNRVLRFDNAGTKATFANADAVLGQADFTTNTNALTQNRMFNPVDAYCDPDGSTLWVADANNDRILRFDNASSKANGANADGVLGQLNFTSSNTGPTQTQMNSALGLCVIGTTLFASDLADNRILVWEDAASLSNGAPADKVLGQPNFTANAPGTSATSLNGPRLLHVDEFNNLYALDDNNERALIFYEILKASQFSEPADVVLGQPNMTTSGANTTQSGLNNPRGLYFLQDNGVRFFNIMDRGNHRIMTWGIRYDTDDNMILTDFLRGEDPAGTGTLSFNITYDPPDDGATISVINAATGEFQIEPDACFIGDDTAVEFEYSVTNGNGCVEFVNACSIVRHVETCVCGDGILQSGEECDDGDTGNGDGCSSLCTVEGGWKCEGEPSTCTEIECGDGLLEGTEQCDDGDLFDGDGCSSLCTIEAGWECNGASPSTCNLICSNGALDPGESCDDTNTMPGDGCDENCQVECGFTCNNSPMPSVCSGMACVGCLGGSANGILEMGEECDDDNAFNDDGCSQDCLLEEKCGDGTRTGSEQCDDGNVTKDDGCTYCEVDLGATCTGANEVTLVDMSFEIPIGSASCTQYTSADNLGAWFVDSGEVKLCLDDDFGGSVACPVGAQCMDLRGNTTGGKLCQDMRTVSGTTYSIRFRMARNGGTTLANMTATAANTATPTTIHTSLTYTTSTDPLGNWDENNFSFSATSSSTQVCFESTSGMGGLGGAIIDVKDDRCTFPVLYAVIDGISTTEYDISISTTGAHALASIALIDGQEDTIIGILDGQPEIDGQQIYKFDRSRTLNLKKTWILLKDTFGREERVGPLSSIPRSEQRQFDMPSLSERPFIELELEVATWQEGANAHDGRDDAILTQVQEAGFYAFHLSALEQFFSEAFVAGAFDIRVDGQLVNYMLDGDDVIVYVPDTYMDFKNSHEVRIEVSTQAMSQGEDTIETLAVDDVPGFARSEWHVDAFAGTVVGPEIGEEPLWYGAKLSPDAEHYQSFETVLESEDRNDGVEDAILTLDYFNGMGDEDTVWGFDVFVNGTYAETHLSTAYGYGRSTISVPSTWLEDETHIELRSIVTEGHGAAQVIYIDRIDLLYPSTKVLDTSIRTTDSDWRNVYTPAWDVLENANYIIVTPIELEESAIALQEYRADEFQVAIVSYRSIMDEYGLGEDHPNGLTTFLEALDAKTMTQKYVVLFGDGHYDFKTQMVEQLNLIPPPMVNIEGALSIQPFAFEHILIGRLPFESNSESRRYIERLQAFEQSRDMNRKEHILFASDEVDSAGFDAVSAHHQIGSLVQGAIPFTQVAWQTALAEESRSRLSDALSRQPTIMSYLGHAGYNQLGKTQWANIDDFVSASDSPIPLVVGWTCLLNHYGVPWLETFGESLLQSETGGALAVLSPASVARSGLLADTAAVFFDQLRRGEISSVGELILRTQLHTAHLSFSGAGSDGLILLGDPALMMPQTFSEEGPDWLDEIPPISNVFEIEKPQITNGQIRGVVNEQTTTGVITAVETIQNTEPATTRVNGCTTSVDASLLGFVFYMWQRQRRRKI